MCDGEPLEYQAPARWIKARKAHRCCVCTETIRVGDRYHYLAGRFEGDWMTWKHCARCWMMFEALCRYTDEVLFELNCGEEWESLTGEPPPDDVAELAFLSANDAQKRVREIGAEK